MKHLHEIIVRPLSTEKTETLASDQKIYTFEVGLNATKIEIKQALEGLYGVRVRSVRTSVVRGKATRFGRHFGKRSNWKKAYVRLADNAEINFGGEI
jgi:large subunit ribosomal protein L23